MMNGKHTEKIKANKPNKKSIGYPPPLFSSRLTLKVLIINLNYVL
jgi:hypothetical protein